MNPTRNLIRSCSGSLTVQHLARRTVANSPRTQFLVGSRRFYSEDTKPSEQKSEGENKDAGPSKDRSEFSKQLAAKEEEVADLKVCLFLHDRWHSITDVGPRVGYGTSRPTSSTFSVTLREKRSRRRTTRSRSLPQTYSRPRMCCHSLSNPSPLQRLNRIHPQHRRQHREENLPRRT